MSHMCAQIHAKYSIIYIHTTQYMYLLLKYIHKQSRYYNTDDDDAIWQSRERETLAARSIYSKE